MHKHISPIFPANEDCLNKDYLAAEIRDANRWRAHKGKPTLSPKYRVADHAAFIDKRVHAGVTADANAWCRAVKRGDVKPPAKTSATPTKAEPAPKAERKQVTTETFAHLNNRAVANSSVAAERILAAGRRARGEPPRPGTEFLHLLGDAPVVSDGPAANVTADQIARAAKKARSATSSKAPVPDSLAGQILAAGRKRRGQI